jgi:oxalate decarboxylase/phosphoglucose isomerase-like protein (cupin superfamily)
MESEPCQSANSAKVATPKAPAPLGGAASVADCRLINLPKVADPRGNLTFIEGGRHVPFEIKRVYYLYDVPGGAERGGHAHKNLHQLIIAMSGSFDVILDDGLGKHRFHLNRSYYGLYVCPMMWREIDNFSSGSICMVLASNLYDEADYYRDYEEFRKALRATR